MHDSLLRAIFFLLKVFHKQFTESYTKGQKNNMNAFTLTLDPLSSPQCRHSYIRTKMSYFYLKNKSNTCMFEYVKKYFISNHYFLKLTRT